MRAHYLFLGFPKDSSINLWHLTILLHFLLYWSFGGKIRKLSRMIHLFPKPDEAMEVCADF